MDGFDADFAGELVSPTIVFRTCGAGTNWAFFWRIRVLRLCERRSSVAGNAVIDDGLGSLPQIDSEDSNGLQCGQGGSQPGVVWGARDMSPLVSSGCRTK